MCLLPAWRAHGATRQATRATRPSSFSICYHFGNHG